MALKMAVALRNARLDAITTFAGASAKLRFYDGTQPATGGAATNLLAECIMNATFADAAAAAVLTMNAIANDAAADATGTATWARIVKSDGTTHVVDLTVTATGGGGDITVGTVSFVASSIISITSATITEANA
jgi:hypothetical protein